MSEKNIKILGIETSCDETSIAVVENGRKVISNIISSQIEIHKKFGGVVPEIASRNHIEAIDSILEQSLSEANLNINEIDAIAVTNSPGLVGALLVGVSFAKSLAYSINKPLIGINHIKAHIFANFINSDLKPPFIGVIISGGHTHILNVQDYNKISVLGKTRDDAAGEVYDKIARAIGLEYPGGPKIDNLAKNGNENAIKFPKANIEKFDFSFSGLKSSVLNFINQSNMKNEFLNLEDLCASFQKNIVETIVEKTISVAKVENINKIAIAGGVASNSYLRKKFTEKCLKENFYLSIPESIFCTDNAAMIASCGYYEFLNNNFSDLKLNAHPVFNL